MDREQIRIELLRASYEILRLKSELKAKKAERQYLQGAFDALTPIPAATEVASTAASINAPEDLE